jgi:hypothetical protein
MNCYSLFAHATNGGEFFTNMTVVSQYEDRRKTARALYEQFGKPLEREHTGEYVVISNNGNTIVGKSLTEVVTHAIDKFGKGHFVFKIGSRLISMSHKLTSSKYLWVPKPRSKHQPAGWRTCHYAARRSSW